MEMMKIVQSSKFKVRRVLQLIGIFEILFSSAPLFSYYSFEDIKTECLARSCLSSPYSSPALMCEDEKSSLYGEFSSLFFNLSSPDDSVSGYYKPSVTRKMFSFVRPKSSYASGVSYWSVDSPIHSESRFSVSLARNLNDFLISRFEDRINFSVTSGIYSLKFKDFPSSEYSDKATSFFFDFSVFARFSDNFKYGIEMRNVGPTDIGISRRENLPKEFIFSVSRVFRNFEAILTFRDTYIGSEFGVAGCINLSKAEILFGLDSNRASLGFEISAKKLKFIAAIVSVFRATNVIQPKIGVRYYLEPIKPRKSKVEMMKEFYNLAYENYINKNYERAIYYWNEVLKINPNHHLSRKNIEKAKKAYKRHYFNLATQEYRSGNYEDAIKNWEKVLQMDPDHELSKKKIEKAREKLKEEETREEQ
jgi:tetratricopeptide (TPR) repeat protein